MQRKRRFFSAPGHHLTGLLCAALLAGCAATPAPAPAPALRPLPEVQAVFQQSPDDILDALAASCDGPAERVLQPRPGVVECRMLMPPEPTAGAILRYGGTVEDLPERVIRLRIGSILRNGQTVYLLSAASFLEVPQQGGGVLRVVYPDPRMDREVLTMLQRLGGTIM